MIATYEQIRSTTLSWDRVFDKLDQWVAASRRIVGSDDLAHDAVQEALHDLWRLETPPQHPEGWLVRAILHRSLKIRRSGQRRAKHEGRAAACRATLDSRDPALLLEQRETRATVHGALQSLPRTHRDILEKRWMDELDYATIADQLDVPVGTVRSRLSRARETLRSTLQRPARRF